MRAWAFALLLSGCAGAGAVPNPDSDRRAIDLAWEVYGAPQDQEPPRSITWHDGCIPDPNVSPGFCELGFEVDGVHTIDVVWEGGYRTRTAYTIAHEVYHAYLWAERHNSDPGHKDAGWQDHGVVDDAYYVIAHDPL